MLYYISGSGCFECFLLYVSSTAADLYGDDDGDADRDYDCDVFGICFSLCFGYAVVCDDERLCFSDHFAERGCDSGADVCARVYV
jgi:hypothetical protein